MVEEDVHAAARRKSKTMTQRSGFSPTGASIFGKRIRAQGQRKGSRSHQKKKSQNKKGTAILNAEATLPRPKTSARREESEGGCSKGGKKLRSGRS